MNLPISPLSLDQLTRDTWGTFDAAAIRQLAPLADDLCYRPKLYKSPDSASELMAAGAYSAHGLKMTPGSLIYGFYLPAQFVSSSANHAGQPNSLSWPAGVAPIQFNVQITDMALGHRLWDEPVSSTFLSNFKPTYYSANFFLCGSFPNLLCAPYPVVGDGLLLVEIWNTASSQQRIELVIATLEPITEVCS